MSGPLRLSFAMAIVAFFMPATAAEASFTQEPGSPFDVGLHPHGVVAADFDGDGDTDVVTVNSTASTVSVLLRQPNGGFEEEAGSPMSIGAGPNEAGVGDFNADGLPDLAVSNYVGSNVSILIRKQAGSFDHSYIHGINNPTAIAVANFGGDARPDIAVSENGSAKVFVLLRVGDTFGPDSGPVASTNGVPYDMEAADFTGDGRPDLALTNGDVGVNTVTILRREAGGGFTQEGVPISVAARPWGVSAADFNGDGRPDLAVTNFGADKLTLLLRDAAGFFTPAPNSPIDVGDGPIGVATGDFNSDGARDIVVANNTGSSVTVLLRDGAGFAVEGGAAVPTDDGAFGVAVTDFDADTRQDLAISNDAGSSVTILLNTTPFPLPPPPPPAPNLDVDGDGVQRPLDCNDNNAGIKPGAVDVPGDGVDQDCSGADAPYPVLNRGVSYAFATYAGGYAKLTRLTVKPVRAGDRVRLTCSGRGCQERRKTIAVAGDKRRLSLLRYVRRAQFRRGAVLKVRVTRPATVGVFFSLRFRGTKAPVKRVGCLQPGATRPSRCSG